MILSKVSKYGFLKCTFQKFENLASVPMHMQTFLNASTSSVTLILILWPNSSHEIGVVVSGATTKNTYFTHMCLQRYLLATMVHTVFFFKVPQGVVRTQYSFCIARPSDKENKNQKKKHFINL